MKKKINTQLITQYQITHHVDCYIDNDVTYSQNVDFSKITRKLEYKSDNNCLIEKHNDEIICIIHVYVLYAGYIY